MMVPIMVRGHLCSLTVASPDATILAARRLFLSDDVHCKKQNSYSLCLLPRLPGGHATCSLLSFAARGGNL
jgi:hypothetical protein